MKKMIFIIAASSLMTGIAHASEKDNECGNPHVQISNLTSEACVLVNHDVVHGNIMSPPPFSILPYDSKRFDMTQTMFGPSVTLSYRCGERDITFNSQQNLCYFSAGRITGTIAHPTSPHLDAKYTTIEGSYFWSKPGSINWQIVNE